MLQLPDDIEQKILDGDRHGATYDLVQRRGITLDEADALVEQWLFDRR